MKLIKVAFIDTETTGRDAKKHGLTQIAGHIDFIYIKDNGVGYESEPKEDFNLLLKPFPQDAIESEALTVQGITIDDLNGNNRLTPENAFDELQSICFKYVDKFDKKDKLFFVGYNSQFDMEFLREFWLKNNDKYFGSIFWFPYIDLMTIAAFQNMKDRKRLDNFKLSTVISGLYKEPIEETALHDAKYDIDITRKLFYFLLADIRL